MPFPPFGKILPGARHLSARALNKMQRGVENASRIAGAGDVSLSSSTGGIAVGNLSPPSVEIQITGAPTGASYPWTEVAAGVTPLTGLRGGTATVNPARETSGNTGVAVGTITRAFLSPDQTGYLFSAGGGGATAKITRQIFTGHGTYTYTPTAGTVAVLFQAVAAGGGGGSATTTTGSQTSAGGGGGGGGYAELFQTSLTFATATIVVGQGGAGGTAGNGSPGGNSTATATGVSVQANGGGGGNAGLATAIVTFEAGGAGGATSGGLGDLVIGGGNGQPGLTGVATQFPLAGSGGDASGPYGGGGGAGVLWSSTGGSGTNPGYNYGGGGSGQASRGVNTGGTGGAGADGIVVVTEYSFT